MTELRIDPEPVAYVLLGGCRALVADMVNEDLEHAERDAIIRHHGYRVLTRRE